MTKKKLKPTAEDWMIIRLLRRWATQQGLHRGPIFSADAMRVVDYMTDKLGEKTLARMAKRIDEDTPEEERTYVR